MPRNKIEWLHHPKEINRYKQYVILLQQQQQQQQQQQPHLQIQLLLPEKEEELHHQQEKKIYQKEDMSMYRNLKHQHRVLENHW